MPLLAVRKDFIVFSGRYDLIIDQIDYADNGADNFIRAGQRWLDRTSVIYKATGTTIITLNEGEWFVDLPCRTISKVWADNGECEWDLCKKEYKHLRKYFPGDPDTMQAGKPEYYSIAPIRLIPESGTTTYPFTKLIFMPPAPAGTQLHIEGTFLQPTLTDDDSTNFWTEQEPLILTMAACRALEISYRNKEGVADWETAIKTELLGLEMDLAELESNEFTQMWG